jgi:hypothetical protein
MILFHATVSHVKLLSCLCHTLLFAFHPTFLGKSWDDDRQLFPR